MQFVRTADGVPVWGRSFHVARADLLTIEEEVSQQVADALRVQLRVWPARLTRVRSAPRDPAAYASVPAGSRAAGELFGSEDAGGDRELRTGGSARASIRPRACGPGDSARLVQRALCLPEGRNRLGKARRRGSAPDAGARSRHGRSTLRDRLGRGRDVVRTVQLGRSFCRRWTKR